MEGMLHVNIKRVLEISVILLLVTLMAEGQTPTLTISPSPVEIGSNFTAVCNVAINNRISFLVGNNEIGSCPAPFLGTPCTSTEIERNTTTQTTTWTQIADLNHEGSWICRRLADDSLPTTLNMYKCPASTRSENGIGSNLELNDTLTSAVNVTFETECIYPPNNTEIVLQFKSGSQELDASISCAASATTCTVGTAYECNHQISYGMSLMNDGKFEFSRNYTIHFKVSTRIKDCEGVAIFDRYSLLFIQSGELISRDTTCDAKLIYAVHFIWTLSVAVFTFFAVIFIKMKRPKIGSKYILILAAVLIDVVFECIMLWGIEYRSDFETFRTNDACNVVIIGVVCHVVIIVILVIKVVALICFTERIQECMVSCCVSRKTTETTVESGPSANRSNDHSSTNGVEKAVPPHTHKITQPVTTPEDITLLMHFSMPTGYQVHYWVKEDSTSLQDSNRHVTSDRGTLHIKSATAEDNGIYQSLLVSGNSELRVNVILHVTGLKSVCLMVDPLVWRLIKTKKLKQIHDLKKISKLLSINNVEGIPSNLKRSEETDVTVKSIRWTHNGKEITGPSPWKGGNNHLQRFTVQRETPIDEYHCKIEFSDRKSHIFIFIVKFTGSAKAKPNLYPSYSLPTDKVYPIEEVVGVPTIINTKREETDSKLKPLRATAMTTITNVDGGRDGLVVYEHDFNPMTARSGQSTEREEQL